jgi:hypothetical protein
MIYGSIRFWHVAAATIMLLGASACSGYSSSGSNYMPPHATPTPISAGPGSSPSPTATPYTP